MRIHDDSDSVTADDRHPRLLPYERWFTEAVARRQQTRETRAYRQYRAKYGPDGTALLLAGQLTGLVASILVLVSIILLPISQLVAHWLFGVGLAIGVLCLTRAGQAARAGKRFRRERGSSSEL